jgi:hypothetical protein
MPLFLAQHSHAPERCPAATPVAAEQLLAHIAAAAAARYGVAIQAEAVLEEHVIYLILEAASQEQVECYMAYFAPLGTVRIRPAVSGEEAVTRQGCAAGRDAQQRT